MVKRIKTWDGLTVIAFKDDTEELFSPIKYECTSIVDSIRKNDYVLIPHKTLKQKIKRASKIIEEEDELPSLRYLLFGGILYE